MSDARKYVFNVYNNAYKLLRQVEAWGVNVNDAKANAEALYKKPNEFLECIGAAR